MNPRISKPPERERECRQTQVCLCLASRKEQQVDELTIAMVRIRDPGIGTDEIELKNAYKFITDLN